ncbi:alpha/beta hydrolase [Aquimarina sp. AU58]|uniref:alpha/beta hydrolase n=1 Tax=Aquimarina sp. AU58 TaxID=1874112 RepID=UPI000D64DD20|nr:alpha/beta hydrolase-fold protein [Aquimarina sp. AU58]
MKTTQLLILTCVLSLNIVFAQENNINDGIQTVEKSYLELPRIQVIPIKDTKNDRQYELYIKLPEGYSENGDIKYPVLYFTDALKHIEILSGSAEHVVENTILVGISWQKDLKGKLGALGEHASRFRDYSIMKSSNPEHQAKYQRGQASNHLDFIRNDVIKYVENNYQTDPDNRSYFGYSMGAKFGAYILFVQPDTFKNYILGSPGALLDGSYIYEHEPITALNQKELNANVFVSIGALEKESMLGHAKGLVSILKSKNYTNVSSKLVVIESANHGGAFPMSAVRGMYWLSDLTKE